MPATESKLTDPRMPSVPVLQSSVWIVDDNPLDGSKARNALSADYRVSVFSDPAAALERLGTGCPDVLLLDWIMPGMSGLDVCRFVRSNSAASNLGVVIMTAQTDPEQVAEALAAGADDFVSKPIADVELRARVGGVVRAQRAIARAERAEAEVSRLLASAPDALVVADGRGVVTFVNRQAERAIGRPAGELEGVDIDQAIPGLAAMALSAETRPVPLQLPDIAIGTRVYSPGVIRDGVSGKITLSLRDVTERRHEESRRLDLYSVVAHDLRSPLASLLMRIDLILRGRRGLLSSELTSDLHKMQSSVREQIAMISDFLDLGRLEESGAQLERSDVDLCAVIANVCEQLAPLAEASRVALRVETVGGPATVSGDARRLAQAVSNLMGNALKFTASNSEVLVRIATNDESVEVSVKDTGPGLEPDQLPTLFKRYVRPLEGQHDIPGTGLGLMIVREIVERHEGQVAVESRPGSGSTFSFQLPRRHTEVSEVAGRHERRAK